jgi:hypothetical protein
MSATLYFLGDFESARERAMLGAQIWRSRGSQSHAEDLDTPVVGWFWYEGFSEWHLERSPLTLHLAVPKTRLGADMQTKREIDTLVDLKNRQLGAVIFVQGYLNSTSAMQCSPRIFIQP